MRFLRSLFLFFTGIGSLYAESVPPKLPILSERVEIDGKLDEAVWSKALPLTGFTALAAQAGVDTSLTTGAIWADKEAIYIGVRCAAPEIGTIPEKTKARDEAVGIIDDAVEIFFDPEARGFQYYQLIVNASNSHVDLFWIESGMNQGGDWNPHWQSAVHRGEDFYSVEVRIPLSAFHFTPNAKFADAWLFNLVRSRAQGAEYTSWSPLRRGFHEPQSFRKIAGFPRKPEGTDFTLLDLKAAPVAASEDSFPHQLTGRLSGGDLPDGPVEIRLAVNGASPTVTRFSSLKEGPLSLGEVRFPGVGQRYWVNAQIVGGSGRVYYEAAFRIASSRAALVNLRLDEPFYRNAIFPGQTLTEVRGQITGVAAPAGKNATITLKLVSAGEGESAGTPIGEPMTLEWKGTTIPFSLPVQDLAPGSYRLDLLLSGGPFNEARESISIRKLAPTRGGYAYIDGNLNFVMNGTPTIPRSVMGYGPKDFLISTAVNENFSAIGLPEDTFYHTGLIANAENDRVYPPSKGEMERSDDELPPELYAAYDELIERFKDQPHIAYYLSDEPECRALSPVFLQRIYNYLREKDPYRAVLIVSREPQLFVDCADIISPHPYNNPSILDSGRRVVEDSRKTAELIRRIYDAGEGRVQPWITPQLHTYSIADKNAVYPVFEEFLNPTMAAMVAGAKGVFPYVFYEQLNTLDMRWGVPYVYRLIGHTQDFWLAPALPIKVESSNDGIIATLRRAGDISFLAVVNLVPGEGTVTLQGEELAAISQWYPYAGSTAPLSRRGKAVQIQVEGSGVHFFTSQPLHTDPVDNGTDAPDFETLPAFRKRLAEGNRALAKPGNLLFGKRFETLWRATGGSPYTPAEYMAETLTNGITDAIGFVADHVPVDIEVGMRKTALELNRLVVYSATVTRIKVSYWKAGEWQPFGEGANPDSGKIEVRFPETVRTAKLRITLEGNRPGLPVEVYEIEAYNDHETAVRAPANPLSIR